MKNYCSSSRLVKRLFSLSLVVVCLLLIFVPAVSAANVPTITSIKVKSSEAVVIKWKKHSSATGYVIYQKKEDGYYKKIKTIKNVKTTSYTKTDLDSATKYSYKIKAYTSKKVNGKTKTTYTGYSNAKSVYTKLEIPSIKSIQGITSTSIRLKWKEIDEADGYIVYKKTSDGYEKVTTIRDSFTNGYTVKNLKESRKYGFAIKAYKKIDGKNIYSDLSGIKYSFPAMPVELQNLYCIDASYKCGYVNEPMTDSYGNVYNGYFQLSGSPYTGYVIYNLENKYSKLSFDIVVASGVDSSLSANIEVYADDVLIYSKTQINKTSGKIHVDLDVENCEALKIFTSIMGYSWGDSAYIVNAKVEK